jgi:hypothetical protein
MKGFARCSSAQKGPVAGVPKNSNRAAEDSYLAAGFAGENSCGVGVILTPRLREMQALFDCENPCRSGGLAGFSFATTLESHPRYPTLRRRQHRALFELLDDAVADHLSRLAPLLRGLGFDEPGITIYRAATLTAFRAAFPTN